MLLNKPSERQLLLGPSHLVRWRQQIADGVLPPHHSTEMKGWGGAPVWSQSLLDIAEEFVRNGGEQIVLLVGDFRFGNAAVGYQKDDLFHDGFFGINLDAIGVEQDLVMRAKAIRALAHWSAHFGSELRLVFWDLFCRQVMDRLRGKYIVERRYEHPTWTLVAIQDCLGGTRALDLQLLIETRPMHELMRLFIDDSCHPSFAGYSFLGATLMEGRAVDDAFDQALAAAENALAKAASDLVGNYGPLLLCGRSVWLDTLLRCLGPRGVARLREIGLLLQPSNPQLGHSSAATEPTWAQQLPSGILAVCRVDKLSGQSIIDQDTADLVIHWQLQAGPVIASRGETPIISDSDSTSCIQRSALELRSGDVELGPLGQPTQQGFLSLLEHVNRELRQGPRRHGILSGD